jgi:hypothetical protein
MTYIDEGWEDGEDRYFDELTEEEEEEVPDDTRS